MGASQSSEDAPQGSDAITTKTCFYELLGLDKDATDTEIKKAYRRRALELHPDRNFGDVAVATQKFAELQSAYEVLSDPHERAWYDSHRDAILSGQDGDGDGQRQPSSFRNIRLTSTEEILSLIRKFNPNIAFDDEPTGFFGVARETFEHLALEEEAAAEAEDVDISDYPSFGFSDDQYDSAVKSFYSAWAGFATKKSFSWKDKYRLSDAPDRRIRRLMEKENKKLREDAAREFNEAVRFLVTFVRKRDPRYTPNTQSQADRLESSRNAAAAQAARSRAANHELFESYEVPDWVKSRSDDPDEHFALSEDESEIEILECVICNKSFKSEKQFQAHERSKKHIKATANLRREMRKEGLELALDDKFESGHQSLEGRARKPESDSNDVDDRFEDTVPDDNSFQQPVSPRAVENEEEGCSVSSASSHPTTCDDDYASRGAVLDRLATGTSQPPDSLYGKNEIIDDSLSSSIKSIRLESGSAGKTMGKAKAKRERKAAAAAAKEANHSCTVCGECYDSRTKLFNHIRREDHAAAITARAAGQPRGTKFRE